jgi:hypothetical protein
MIGGRAVKDGRMWLIGGGTYQTPGRPGRTYANDVWSSADGSSWKCHTADAPWEPRAYHDVAVFDDKLWVLGGANFGGETTAAIRGPTEVNLKLLHVNPVTGKADPNRNDVWWSRDGETWHELENTAWDFRHACSVFVHRHELFMVSGNGNDHAELLAEVWKLEGAHEQLAAKL